jgi:two-component system, response regulator
MNVDRSIELMLVEDNPQDLELALLALKQASPSIRIHIARDGAEALDFLFCDGPFADRLITDTPMVILLDLKLPKIDGLDVLKRIKGDPRTSAIPVVVLTSSSEQQDLIESYKLGVNSYIVKPVNYEQYTAVVRELGLYWMLTNRPLAAAT